MAVLEFFLQTKEEFFINWYEEIAQKFPKDIGVSIPGSFATDLVLEFSNEKKWASEAMNVKLKYLGKLRKGRYLSDYDDFCMNIELYIKVLRVSETRIKVILEWEESVMEVFLLPELVIGIINTWLEAKNFCKISNKDNFLCSKNQIPKGELKVLSSQPLVIKTMVYGDIVTINNQIYDIPESWGGGDYRESSLESPKYWEMVRFFEEIALRQGSESGSRSDEKVIPRESERLSEIEDEKPRTSKPKSRTGGRPRLQANEWAYDQVNNKDRDPKKVFPEWKTMRGKNIEDLVDPEDSFKKVIRPK